jgi:hypothetical protein
MECQFGHKRLRNADPMEFEHAERNSVVELFSMRQAIVLCGL